MALCKVCQQILFTPATRFEIVVGVSQNNDTILFIVQLKIQFNFFFVVYIYLLLFSYSCTFHVAAYLKTCHLTRCIPTTTWYRVYDTENLEQSQRDNACTPSSVEKKKKKGQIYNDIEFEEYVQGHDWSRKTDLTPLNFEPEPCLKFQHLLLSQDLSSLVPSSFF